MNEYMYGHLYLKVFKLTMYLFSWDSFDGKKMVSIYFLFLLLLTQFFSLDYFQEACDTLDHLGTP